MEPTTYTVQILSSAYTGRIPWWRATDKLTSTDPKRICQVYRRWDRWYHPEPNAWSGHVRVIGVRNDELWEYAVSSHRGDYSISPIAPLEALY